MAPNLFEGARFWVDANVPMRTQWLDQIAEHGGVLTRDMDTADVRITDHVQKAGKAFPENAVSYTFIEQSVKKGALEDMEDHRISVTGRKLGGAARPSKGRRAQYSLQDDQELANWLALMEAENKSLSGNKIYQDLEKICPQHTWHSWRSRAMNYKGLLPKPTGLDRFRERVEQAAAAAREGPSSAIPPSQTQRPPAAPPSSARYRTSAGAGTGRVKFTEEDDQLLLRYVKQAGKYQNGNKIYVALAEEYPHHSFHSWRDRYVRHLQPRLETEAEAAGNEAEDAGAEAEVKARTATKGISQRSEQTKPSGATRVLPNLLPAPKKPDTSSTTSDWGSAHPASNTDPHGKPSTTRSTSAGASKIGSLVVEPERRSRPKSIAARSPARDKNSDERPTEPTTNVQRLLSSQELLDRRLATIKSAKLIQRYWRGHQTRRAIQNLRRALKEETRMLPVLQACSRGVLLRCKLRDFINIELVRLQAQANGAMVRMALRDEDGENKEDKSVRGIEEQLAEAATAKPQQSKTEKEAFYTDWWIPYLDATRKDIQSVQWPKVQGRTLDLWELWHTVTSLDEGRSQSARNWEDIAERLGFDWVDTPEVTLELKNCYQKTLGEFEKFHAAFKADFPGSQIDTDTQASVAKSEASPEAEPQLRSDTLGLRSSPPVIHGSKRSFEDGPARSSMDLSFMSAKRPRYSKDAEIPTTPETTPERQRKRAAVTLEDILQPLSSLPHGHAPVQQQPPPTKTRLEPETQDFGFQSQPDLASVVDSTPSQQFHVENQQLSPIPFSGFKPPNARYKSPLGTQQDPKSSMPKVIPDSMAARPARRLILVPVEDPFADDITPKAAQARKAPARRSPSPVPAAKRRSLPASFHRAVTPPKAGSKKPLATPRVSLPTRLVVVPLPTAGRPSAERLSLHSTSTVKPRNGADLASGQQPHSRSRPSSSSLPAGPRIIALGPRPPPNTDLAETIKFYTKLGHRRKDVIAAFKATMDWGLAARVMDELQSGRGLPESWAGVWTAADDADLGFVMAVDAEMEERRAAGGRPDHAAKERGRRAERCRMRLAAKHYDEQMIRDREGYLRSIGKGC